MTKRLANSEPNELARRIYNRLRNERHFTLGKAREVYREAFGKGHDDVAINQEYEQLLQEHVGTGSDGPVPLPLPLAVALYLREGLGRKRGPVPKPDDIAALEFAKEKAAEYKNKGYTAEAAKEKAANFVTKLFYLGANGEPRFITKLSPEQVLERLSHPGRYGLLDDDIPRNRSAISSDAFRGFAP
jgi:hypothetical protein